MDRELRNRVKTEFLAKAADLQKILGQKRENLRAQVSVALETSIFQKVKAGIQAAGTPVITTK